MTTLDIIKFTIDSATTDGYVELSKINQNSLITVRTNADPSASSNQTLLYKFITNNFADVSFDDINTSCTLVYKDGVLHPISATISFDKSSSSAYTEFKKTFTEMSNTKYETEYYPSGRVMYVGEVLYKKKDELVTRIPNGVGTLYYDIDDYKIKYMGEFESGLYDGAGTFYNQDNKITIIVNNISSGIPTQKGKLKINYTKKKATFDIVFNDIWVRLNQTDKNNRKILVSSDNFVNMFVKLFWTEDKNTIDSLVFSEKSSDDKYLELWQLIRRNTSSLEKITSFDKIYTERVDELTKIAWCIFLLIILNMMMCFSMWYSPRHIL